MRKLAMAGIVVLCAAAVGVLCVEGSGDQEQQAPSAIPSIDVAKPQTWSKDVAEAQKILDAMAADLIAIAKDEKRLADDRIAAIRLLGRIGNRTALHFLVSNVSLQIEPSYGGGYLGPWRPCRQTLAEFGSPAGEAIFKAIHETESEEDLKHLAYALGRVYRRPEAAVIVLGDQGWVTTERGRKKSQVVKKFLEDLNQ